MGFARAQTPFTVSPSFRAAWEMGRGIGTASKAICAGRFVSTTSVFGPTCTRQRPASLLRPWPALTWGEGFRSGHVRSVMPGWHVWPRWASTVVVLGTPRQVRCSILESWR